MQRGRRILLVHWNEEEAASMANVLRDAGHEVTTFHDAKANPKAILAFPSDLVLISLRRVPSHGRELGAWLRRRVQTRSIPLLFIQGDAEKTNRVRSLLPDAVYAKWEDILEGIERAQNHPPADPVVPGTMDAYEGTSLPDKLGVKDTSTVVVFGRPSDMDLPERVMSRAVDDGTADIVLAFFRLQDELSVGLAHAVQRMVAGGRLWILWPKKASGVASDLSERIVRTTGLDSGLVDYKIASIDATWSGLCFARRTSVWAATCGPSS